MSGFLYKREIPINDKISIYIPTVGEVLDNEDEYYSMAVTLTAVPFDMMVQLTDMGIDFTSIDEYQLFLMLFSSIKEKDVHLIFKNLSLSNFEFKVNPQNNMCVLYDELNNIIIDKAIHRKIGIALRTINFFEKTNKRPANKEAMDFLIERTRIKQKRARAKNTKSQLENLIVSLVNTGEFPYDFETVRNLTMYQFNASVRQVMKKINFDNTMIGCYSGAVSSKDLTNDQLSWININ